MNEGEPKWILRRLDLIKLNLPRISIALENKKTPDYGLRKGVASVSPDKLSDACRSRKAHFPENSVLLDYKDLMNWKIRIFWEDASNLKASFEGN